VLGVPNNERRTEINSRTYCNHTCS